MDRIWYSSKSEAIGRYGGDKKRMATQNQQK